MKVHTVIVGEGESVEDAIRRVLKGDEAPKDPVPELAVEALAAMLDAPGVTAFLYERAEKKLGRKPKRKVMDVPVFGGALKMPVDTIDPDDAEWFAAMHEPLKTLLDAIGAIKLSEL